MDVAAWLRGLGLERYTPAFRDNDIDGELLRRLTAEDLRELGVASVGHRRRLLDAIAALGASTPAADTSGVPAEKIKILAPGGDAERRQLTVMFCDLVDSTALAGRLDPEDLRAVIAAYHRCVADVVGRFNGFIAKYMGDGVLAYFGFPAAHEDDAERAVRAGLEIARAVVDLDSRGSSLSARIGIATGLVVVGDLGGGEAHAVVGEIPNLAARLQAEAPPGGVVIDRATRRLGGTWFLYRDLGPHRLKGIAEPVLLTQALRERAVESRFAALRSAVQTPFVGREQEIGLLTDRWHMASEGEGQVVMLSGEAGIGKSRIAEVLRERIAAGTRIRYQCSPYHTNTAFYPIMTQLAAAARIEPEEPSERKLDKLERLILPAAIAPEVALPLLADLLAIPIGNRCPALTIGPELRKMRTLQVLSDQLFALARRAPVLILLEDAHWIDPTTRELIDSVIEPIGRRPAMLLVTCRPEFTNPWGHYTHVASLALTRLGRRQAAALVAGAAGRSLPEPIAEAIIARADGVPLFIEELTKSIVESGLSRAVSEASTRDSAFPTLAIPSTLQGSLLARLDRLGGTREVAQLGAAIGREFGYGLLAAVADLPSDRLQAALLELEAAGLVFRRGSSPEAVYSFKHALVQDAAHDSLLKSRRRQLHARIAQAIERHYPETASSQPQLLAQHYAEAGLAEHSARAWLAAGRLAASRSASHEAVMQFARGIDVLQSMEAGAERDRLELDLHVGRGSACALAYGTSAVEAERAWERAIALLHDQPEDPRNFWARRGLSAAYATRANMTAYAAITRETMEHARQSGDPAGLCVAHMMFANLNMYTGKIGGGERSIAEAAQYYRADVHHGSVHLSGLDIGVHIPLGLMTARSFRGDYIGAEQCMNEGLLRAEAQPQVATLCFMNVWASLRCLLERDFERAGILADRAVAVAAEHGIGFWATVGGLAQGGAAVIVDPGRAVMQIEASLSKLESLRAMLWHQPYLCCQAEALLRLGRTAEARAVADRAIEMARSNGMSWWNAELHRIRAAVIRAEGGGDAAVREALSRAVAIAAEQGSETFRRRAAAEFDAVQAEAGGW
jgi:class 3 adenylate cyclase